MFSFRQRFRHVFENKIDRWPDFLGTLMLGLGLIVFISEYFGWSTLYIPILSDLLLRIWPELIGIGLAVIIIDNANELLRTREEKERLILQMGSPNNAFAIEAVRQLRVRGWLYDRSLRGADLGHADLRGANLQEADLQGANLWGTNLENAELERTDLQGTILWEANLQEADLDMANLRGARMWEAILKRTSLVRANLQDTI